MRLVIIEDEPKSREGIFNMIHKYTDYLIEGVAENGADGLNLICEKRPDLVISDIRMPLMSGLEMVEKLREKGIECQVILLTGYSDFEYARRALQLQVAEYILKPVQLEELLKELQKAEMRMEKKKIETVSAEQMIWSYISETEADETVLQTLGECLQVNEYTESTVFLIRPTSIATETVQEMMRSAQKMLDMFCIDNYYLFRIPEERGFFIMAVDTRRNPNLEKIFEGRVLKELSKISPCVCSVKKLKGLSDFRECLKKLGQLLKYSFSLPENTIADERAERDIQYEKMNYPDNLEQSVIREIRSGNSDKILKCGTIFQQKVIESNACPECIREYTMRFTASILRVAGEIHQNMERELPIQYVMNQIAQSETKAQVRYQLDKIIHAAAKLDEEFQVTENGMILNVIAFIRENYSRDITLSEAARLCGVTQEYLSKIFAQEVGMNFTAFLQNFRISMAKRMMFSGKCKVYEVSEAVGFHDQKYFTKVFKKLCGVTPAEYKRENVT